MEKEKKYMITDPTRYPSLIDLVTSFIAAQYSTANPLLITTAEPRLNGSRKMI